MCHAIARSRWKSLSEMPAKSPSFCFVLPQTCICKVLQGAGYKTRVTPMTGGFRNSRLAHLSTHESLATSGNLKYGNLLIRIQNISPQKMPSVSSRFALHASLCILYRHLFSLAWYLATNSWLFLEVPLPREEGRKPEELCCLTASG